MPIGKKDPPSHSYGKRSAWEASGDFFRRPRGAVRNTVQYTYVYPYDFRREARPVKPVSDHLARFERRRCLFLDSKWYYIIKWTASSWCWHQLLSRWRCHLRLSRAVIVVFSARTLRVKKNKLRPKPPEMIFSMSRISRAARSIEPIKNDPRASSWPRRIFKV